MWAEPANLSPKMPTGFGNGTRSQFYHFPCRGDAPVLALPDLP
ncbi:hypothetical protein [Tumidithrix helvetica]